MTKKSRTQVTILNYTMILSTLCYLQHRNKTLMLHRIKKHRDIHDGKWNGLGGKLIPGETPEECVIREVYEESGLTIKHPVLRGLLTFPDFSNDVDWYVYVFTASEFNGELQESEEGVLEWIDQDKLTGLHLWEGDSIFLKWLEGGRVFFRKFVYKNGKFISHFVVFY